MSLLASLLLAAVVAAEPHDPRGWIKPLDYPPPAFRQTRGGVTAFELTFSAEGKPMRCVIAHSSGWDDLDKATCDLLLVRGRVKPALDSQGHPAIFVYRSSHRWFMEGMKQKAPNPPRHDIETKLDRPPADVMAPARVEVVFMVGPDGRISDCSPTNPIHAGGRRFAENQRASASLWGEACRLVTAEARRVPVLDANGQAVSSVQTLRVLFTVD
ncbi:energy transducer TonB [Sphingomonas sp. SRS2]|uniref:energy transducer TonB n=1 Tax=Sphingomonas sp. SRS2 TaxID=133190 RepID=UPI0006981960|nr:energy transducer TonB [Sphingomonas sp. SRS2]